MKLPEFLTCGICREYAERRRDVVVPALVIKARQAHVHVRYLAKLYMLGVHERHESGRLL